MGRTLTLRYCGEHQDCQIQSIDGGRGEHTPAVRTLSQRLDDDSPAIKDLERRAVELLGRLADATTGLAEKDEKAGDLLRAAQAGRDQMALLERASAQVVAGAEVVSEGTRRTAQMLGRLESGLQNASAIGERLETRRRELEATEGQLVDTLARGQMLVATLTEQQRQLSAELFRFDAQVDARAERLRRVDALFDVIADARAELGGQITALDERANELGRLITKERDERLADGGKVQRQLRNIAGRLDARPA